MKRDTLMSQVIDESITRNRSAVTLFQTMTSPHDIRQLSNEHGLRFSVHRNQFHLVKFTSYVDEQGEDDFEMIEHDFYF